MKNNSKPTNVRDLISVGQQQLSSANITSARLDTLILLGHVVNNDRAWLLSHLEHTVNTTQVATFKRLIQERAQNTPVAYLIEYKEFYGRNFYVTPEVLIPRPESEQLIERALAIGSDTTSVQALDIGTGSGALGITLALERPSWNITATDISSSALQIAKINAKRLAAQNIVFSVQNLLAGDVRHYDIIIANLPYVPTSLRLKSDIAHEPPLALFAGKDGLDMYRKLFAQLGSRQDSVPNIVTESLQIQHDALSDIASEHNYTLVATQQLIQHFRYGY